VLGPEGERDARHYHLLFVELVERRGKEARHVIFKLGPDRMEGAKDAITSVH